eukprot:6491484-Amphidinium_carterae.3
MESQKELDEDTVFDFQGPEKEPLRMWVHTHSFVDRRSEQGYAETEQNTTLTSTTVGVHTKIDVLVWSGLRRFWCSAIRMNLVQTHAACVARDGQS